MGITSIKSAHNTQQITLNAVFTYQDMVKYKVNRKVSQNYDFLQQIGSGAQGQVFRARCKVTNNIRAIKKINKFRNPKTVENIENQFNILKHIDHPCIVKMYEMFEEDIYFYIVTELCQGKELFQLIIDDKVIGEQNAFPLFYQILTTINFLHKNHIMHRDIKPQNIIVNPSTHSIKLIDLGSSTKFQDSHPKKRKRIGTSYYIAPEVLKREYNQKCDVWSLGVILYILLSGGLPFKGQEDLDVLKAVENGEVEFPVGRWRQVSFAAKEVVKRMLERQVAKRPSAEELLQCTWIKSNMHKLSKQSTSLALTQKTINTHLLNMKKFKVPHPSQPQQLNSNPIQDGVFIFIVNFVQNKQGQKEFLQTFRALDTNRDGVISLQQLTTGLQKYLKMKRSQCQIIARKIFDKVDVNNSHSIDYSEFVMSASNIEIVVTEENIDLAFNYIDVDGSGKLTVQEIREKLGDSVTEAQYNALLKEFDKNSDGEISRYEFRDMMKALVKKPGSSSSAGTKTVLNSNGHGTTAKTHPSMSNQKPPTSSHGAKHASLAAKHGSLNDLGMLKRTSVAKTVKK